MMSVFRPGTRSLTFISVVLLALVGAAPGRAAAGHGDPPPPKLRGTVVWPSGMRPALPFALHDQDGRLLTLQSLHGHVSVVTFMNARCTQACPVIGRELALTQRKLGGSRSPLMVVIIDVNPAEDRPTNVRAFVHKVGLVGNWHWLLGRKAQLSPVWRTWGTYVKWAQPDIIHTAAVYLIDQKGFVRVADEVPFSPDWLAGSVRALLARPARQG